MGVSVAQIGMEPCPSLSASPVMLADLICALGPGSLCLCCGSPLTTLFGDREGSLLGCPRCGAEVEVCEDLVLQQAA